MGNPFPILLFQRGFRVWRATVREPGRCSPQNFVIQRIPKDELLTFYPDISSRTR